MSCDTLNNRTLVGWALKLGILDGGPQGDESCLAKADEVAAEVPAAFSDVLRELVRDDTYRRFGDFAGDYYRKNPEALTETKHTIEEITEAFDSLGSKQRSGDSHIGELVAKAGFIQPAHIEPIEDLHFQYYHKHKPFQLILKERYEARLHNQRQRRLVVGVALSMTVLVFAVLLFT